MALEDQASGRNLACPRPASDSKYGRPFERTPVVEHEESADEWAGPITPAWSSDALVDRIISNLPGPNPTVPSPFSRYDLRVAIVTAGVDISSEGRYVEVRDQVLEHIDYEWHTQLDQFVPRIGSTLVENIETVAETIAPRLDGELPANIEADLAAWSDVHGLAEVDNSAAVIARQSAFSILLAATTYESRHRRGDLPSLPKEPEQAISVVRDRQNSPAFEECVLDTVIEYADEHTVATLLRGRHRLVGAPEPAPKISDLFERLFSNESRRSLGQFRTPPVVSDLMQTWTVSDGDRVLDPGAGSCILSAPPFANWTTSTDPGEIIAVDASPLGARMSTSVLTLHNHPNTVLPGDFLSTAPDDLDVPVDAIPCNPPFVGIEDLDAERKEDLNRQAEHLTGFDIPRTTPLHGYFYYHLRQFLDDGGRAAVITSNFLNKEYGRTLKQYLLAEFDVTGFVWFDPTSESIFDTAQVTGLVAFLEANDDTDEASETRFVRVDEFPGKSTLIDFINDNNESGASTDLDWGHSTTIQQGDLDPTQPWERHFQETTTPIATDDLPSLSELGHISRGPNTGCVDFFCLSEPTRQQLKIDSDHLAPIARRASSLQTSDGAPSLEYRKSDWVRQREADREVWLLYHLTDGPERLPDTDSSQLNRYLKRGLSEDGAATTQTAQDRRRWYRLPRREPPQAIVTASTRTGFRFVLNSAQARTVNTLFGLYIDVELDSQECNALLGFLNSGVAQTLVREYSRTRQTGLEKLEPNDLDELPVIDPRSLPREEVELLAEKFVNLCEAARADEPVAPVVTEIDESIKQICSNSSEVYQS